MELSELYIKTAFCCMACDGDIADEEVSLIIDYNNKHDYFKGLQVENIINDYISEINNYGMSFINTYLTELSDAELTPEQEMIIVKIAIEMIEADNIIQYSEVKFFKKIRKCLKISDEVIMREYPDKEDFLLPDIEVKEYEFVQELSFEKIDFKKINEMVPLATKHEAE